LLIENGSKLGIGKCEMFERKWKKTKSLEYHRKTLHKEYHRDLDDAGLHFSALLAKFGETVFPWISKFAL